MRNNERESYTTSDGNILQLEEYCGYWSLYEVVNGKRNPLVYNNTYEYCMAVLRHMKGVRSVERLY